MLLIEQILLHGGSSDMKLRKVSKILQWIETESRIVIFKAGNSFLYLQTQGSHRMRLISGQATWWKFNDHNCKFLHSHFLKSFYCLEKLIMSNGTSEPLMCWETSSLVESSKFFQQQCNLYSVKGITENKQVDKILLLSGIEGLRCYNSWTNSTQQWFGESF